MRASSMTSVSSTRGPRTGSLPAGRPAPPPGSTPLAGHDPEAGRHAWLPPGSSDRPAVPDHQRLDDALLGDRGDQLRKVAHHLARLVRGWDRRDSIGPSRPDNPRREPGGLTPDRRKRPGAQIPRFSNPRLWQMRRGRLSAALRSSRRMASSASMTSSRLTRALAKLSFRLNSLRRRPEGEHVVLRAARPSAWRRRRAAPDGWRRPGWRSSRPGRSFSRASPA